tara:strand:- start:219 stop:833 length:615 start_codon:yes stop_codon:yes gene_type:complete
MFKYLFILYLIINSILFIKFDQFTYSEKFEDIEILDRLPSKIYNTEIIQSLKKIKIKKPNEKSWNNELITGLAQSRYLNYGANLKFKLSGDKKYCIETTKVIKVFGNNEEFFQLSSNYKKLYSSNRRLPEENCFNIINDSQLVINIDVLTEKNYLFINNKKIEINYDTIIKINPLILLLVFIFILSIINIYFFFTKKKNDIYIL